MQWERATRILVAIAVFSAAAFALQYGVILPYRCNVAQKRLEAALLRAFEPSLDAATSAQLARHGVTTALRCLEHHRSNVSMMMILAGNYRVLGMVDEARDTYARALRYDKRPELFLQLGTMELQLGHRDQALAALETAMRFNPHVDADIRLINPDLANEIAARIAAR